MTLFALRTENLSLGYRDTQVLENLTVSFPTGKCTGILGPNGCGKSTLLRSMARLMAPQQGRVLLGDDDVHKTPTRALARRLAILPQSPLAPDGISVADLVRRGRAPWRKAFSGWGAQDRSICGAALQAVALEDLADRPLSELSGGQRQRAWIALVLAQDTPFLLLDEPTTFLDLPHQIDILSLLQRRNREAGTTVISVLHDLNLAARFCDHLLLFGKSGLVTSGPPSDVLTPEALQQAFGLSARVQDDPVTGRPMVIPN